MAQEVAESAVGVGAGVVGFDGHVVDRFAAGREEVAERVQAAFDVEQEGDRLQLVGGLEDDAREPGVGVIHGDGAPVHALRAGGEVEDERRATGGVGKGALIVDGGHGVVQCKRFSVV